MFPIKEKEQRAVIGYLVAERVGFCEVHRRMKIVHEDRTLSLTRVQDEH